MTRTSRWRSSSRKSSFRETDRMCSSRAHRSASVAIDSPSPVTQRSFHGDSNVDQRADPAAARTAASASAHLSVAADADVSALRRSETRCRACCCASAAVPTNGRIPGSASASRDAAAICSRSRSLPAWVTHAANSATVACNSVKRDRWPVVAVVTRASRSATSARSATSHCRPGDSGPDGREASAPRRSASRCSPRPPSRRPHGPQPEAPPPTG